MRGHGTRARNALTRETSSHYRSVVGLVATQHVRCPNSSADGHDADRLRAQSCEVKGEIRQQVQLTHGDEGRVDAKSRAQWNEQPCKRALSEHERCHISVQSDA